MQEFTPIHIYLNKEVPGRLTKLKVWVIQIQFIDVGNDFSIWCHFKTKTFGPFILLSIGYHIFFQRGKWSDVQCDNTQLMLQSRMYSLVPPHSGVHAWSKISYFFVSLLLKYWGSSKHETVPTCNIFCSTRLYKLQFKVFTIWEKPKYQKEKSPTNMHFILIF